MTPALIHHLVDSTATILGISREDICSSSRKRAKGIWYNERIHEDISELAEKVYELAQLNDVNA